MKKLLLIINPGAGRGAMSGSIFEVAHRFTASGYRVEIYPTQCVGDATDKIKKHGGEFDLVVCCGGDGTVNEVVGGLVLLDKRPTLGIIPTGTTNDFSYTIGMPSDIVEACDYILNNSPSPCDTGLFNTHPFIYVAAFGLFTTVTYSTPQHAKQMFGAAAYVVEAIKNFQDNSAVHIKLKYDDGEFEGDYLICMISNTVSMAGFRRMFKNVAQLDDGRFEITLVRRPTSLQELQKVINVLLSVEPVDNNLDFLTVLHSSFVRITAEREVAWTIDGQNAGAHREVDISVSQKSIDIIKT